MKAKRKMTVDNPLGHQKRYKEGKQEGQYSSNSIGKRISIMYE